MPESRAEKEIGIEIRQEKGGECRSRETDE
jgi:hypothetical protein